MFLIAATLVFLAFKAIEPFLVLEAVDTEVLEAEPVMVIAPNKVSDHGLTKHAEASAIQDSCNKSIYQVWRDKYERKYYYLCKLQNDKWGIIPVIISSTSEIWKTAFSPGNGCWADTFRYLSNTATKFTGVVR
jgi:hypothetical protein